MLEKSERTEQTFDLIDRMSSYKSAEGTVTTYGYYADDMRKSKKTVNNAEITQIWSDDDIALELESEEVKSRYVYCGNDPVNMVDPTGMWSGKIHKEISGDALDEADNVTNDSNTMRGLLEGCIDPDKTYSGINKWHGHAGYAKVMEHQIFKARKLWLEGKKKKKNKKKRKQKYYKAYFELGRGLHVVQDFYAHNVKVNGDTVSSRKVATGHFKVKKGKISLEYGWVELMLQKVL